MSGEGDHDFDQVELEEQLIKDQPGFVSGNYFTGKWRWRKKINHRFYTSAKIFHPKTTLLAILILFLTIPFAYISWVLAFLGLNLVVDDIIMMPVIKLIGATTSIYRGHKITKSVINIIGIIIGFLLGGLLGFFVFTNIPALMGAIPFIRSAIDTSITMFAFAGVGSLALSQVLRISPIIIMFFLGSLIIFLPIPSVFSIAVDMVVSSFLLGGFFGAFLTKHLVRGIYKLRYGHSNADGYYHALKDEQLVVDEKLAEQFIVKTDLVKNFRVALIKVLNTIKQVRPYYTEITGSVQLQSNAYKDIFHALMNGKKDDLKALISLEEATDDSYNTYYNQLDKIVMMDYGKGKPISGLLNRTEAFFAKTGGSYNSFSSSESGYIHKHSRHHLEANYAKARLFNHSKASQLVHDEYQNAAKAFYQSAYKT